MKFIHIPFFFTVASENLRENISVCDENNNAKNEHEFNSYGNEKNIL